MQQRSCSIGGTTWSHWIGGAWRAGVFALLLTSATGFASPQAPPQGEIGPFSFFGHDYGGLGGRASAKR